MIGEDVKKFFGSRVMRTITIGRLPIRNLPKCFYSFLAVEYSNAMPFCCRLAGPLSLKPPPSRYRSCRSPPPGTCTVTQPAHQAT
ncbi:hypothetical protein AVEN_107534-1, partial [Araneus ventricosus]